jgi:hypothetical protein
MCVRANTEQDGAFIFMDEVKNILYIIKHAILIVKMNDKLLFFFWSNPCLLLILRIQTSYYILFRTDTYSWIH